MRRAFGELIGPIHVSFAIRSPSGTDKQARNLMIFFLFIFFFLYFDRLFYSAFGPDGNTVIGKC